MQNRNFSSRSASSITHSAAPSPISVTARNAAKASTSPPPAPSASRDDLARMFHTAVVSSRAGIKRDFSAELYELTESASFKAILAAVQQLAQVQGVPERQAAEQIIETFRKMDEVWNDYLFREGIDRIRHAR